MEVANLSVTFAGINADLNDPIAYGVTTCGFTVADYSVVADSDIAQIESSDYPKFLDLCELRLLNSIASNIDVVDVTLGPDMERLGQFHRAINKAILTKEADMNKLYGYGRGELVAGYLEIGSVQEVEDTA